MTPALRAALTGIKAALTEAILDNEYGLGDEPDDAAAIYRIQVNLLSVTLGRLTATREPQACPHEIYDEVSNALYAYLDDCRQVRA